MCAHTHVDTHHPNAQHPFPGTAVEHTHHASVLWGCPSHPHVVLHPDHSHTAPSTLGPADCAELIPMTLLLVPSEPFWLPGAPRTHCRCPPGLLSLCLECPQPLLPCTPLACRSLLGHLLLGEACRATLASSPSSESQSLFPLGLAPGFTCVLSCCHGTSATQICPRPPPVLLHQ